MSDCLSPYFFGDDNMLLFIFGSGATVIKMQQLCFNWNLLDEAIQRVVEISLNGGLLFNGTLQQVSWFQYLLNEPDRNISDRKRKPKQLQVRKKMYRFIHLLFYIQYVLFIFEDDISFELKPDIVCRRVLQVAAFSVHRRTIDVYIQQPSQMFCCNDIY